MKDQSLASRLFDGFSVSPGKPKTSAEYHRQVNGEEHHDERREKARKKGKSHGEIHLAFIAERYKPLEEENEAREKAKEAKKKKKKATYKQIRKNVGKAFHYSWKCLIVGLHSFTAGFSTPISAAANLLPEFHAGKAKS